MSEVARDTPSRREFGQFPANSGQFRNFRRKSEAEKAIGSPSRVRKMLCCSRTSSLREIKIPDLHRRDDHVERFFAAGAHRRAHRFYIRQHVDQTLVEAEIAHSACTRPFSTRTFRRASCRSASFHRARLRGCTTDASPALRAQSKRSSVPPSADSPGAANTILSGISPISLGKGKPWPVASMANAIFVFRSLHARGRRSRVHHPLAQYRFQPAAPASAARLLHQMETPFCSGCATSSQIVMFSPNSFVPIRPLETNAGRESPCRNNPRT